MGEDQTRVKVNIFGTYYTLRDPSGTSREHIVQVARLVDEKMREISDGFKSLDFPRVAVLAAVHLADSCKKLENELAEERQRLEERRLEDDREYKRMASELAELQKDHRKLLEQRDQIQHTVRVREEELETLREDNRKLKLLESEQIVLRNERDEWQARFEKLQSEYEKLQGEYNEWIQLAEDQLKD